MAISEGWRAAMPLILKNQKLWRGVCCQSRLIDIPTGLGKTAAVVLAWLWNWTI
jgi:hypothetical protein